MAGSGRTNRILQVAGLSVMLAGTALAQSPADLHERNRQDAAIALQKAEASVTETILAADALSATSKLKAAERLRQAVASLEFTTIGEVKRKELMARLDAKIASLEGRATIVLPPEDARKVREQALAAMANAKIETDEVTKGLKKINELLEAGKATESARVVTALAAKYPDNPAVTSLRGSNLTQNNLKAWREIQDQYAEAWVADQRNIMASAIPAVQDITFPNKEKWKELTELRRNAMRIKLTEREQKLIESLNTVVTVIIKDRPFQEALQEFSNQIKQEITLDVKSLENAGLDLNSRTNFQGNVSARTALRALLQPQGLTYVVKDEIIQVVTLEKAETQMLTTRSYDVSDIVDVGGQFSNAVQWGPNLAYQQTMQNAEQIVNLIKESIDPRCWKDKGGFCSVSFHLPTKSIVVRASTEVHAALGGAVVGKK